MSSTTVSTPTRRTPVALMGIACLILLVDGYDLYILGTVGPSLVQYEPWGATAATIGVLASATALGMPFGSLFAGWAADRWGRRLPMVIALAWISVIDVGGRARAESRGLRHREVLHRYRHRGADSARERVRRRSLACSPQDAVPDHRAVLPSASAVSSRRSPAGRCCPPCISSCCSCPVCCPSCSSRSSGGWCPGVPRQGARCGARPRATASVSSSLRRSGEPRSCCGSRCS